MAEGGNFVGKGEKDQSTSGPAPDPEPVSAPDAGAPEAPTAASDLSPADGPIETGESAPTAASDTEATADEVDAAAGIAGPDSSADSASSSGQEGPGDDESAGTDTTALGDEPGRASSAGTPAEAANAAVTADTSATNIPEAEVPTPETVIAPSPVADTPQLLAPARSVDTRRSTRRRRRWRRVLTSMAVTMAVMSASAAVSAYVLYHRLDDQITTEEVAEKIGPSRPPVMPEAYGAVNILLMGSDDRTGENKKYGDVGDGTKRSDTTILLHLAADRKTSVAVSIPRDLMVQIPSCVRDDGSTSRAYRDQFNHAFEIGGSACTIKTVELMTQVQIDHHIVIDFTGFKHMVDAVDGVDVCMSEPLKDENARLDLAAGPQKLNGEEALAFVRARYDLGDGSDTQRMVRQQRFLASLMHKVQSNGVLFNPVKLYELLNAATKSITADPGLDSLDELTDLSKSVADIPADQSAFLTVPRQPYRYDTNRDELVQPDADALFTAIRYDRVAVAKSDPRDDSEGSGSVRIDDPTPLATSGSSEDGRPGATSTGTSGTEDGDVTAKPSAGATKRPADELETVVPRTGASSGTASASAANAATDAATSDEQPFSARPSGTGSPDDPSSGGPSPSGSADASTAPSPNGSPSATPSAPAGPIVTVTGRTVEQDVCS